jgi:hypothetical protein
VRSRRCADLHSRQRKQEPRQGTRPRTAMGQGGIRTAPPERRKHSGRAGQSKILDYEWCRRVAAFGQEATFLPTVTPSVRLITHGGINKRGSRATTCATAPAGRGAISGFLFFREQPCVHCGSAVPGKRAAKTDYSCDGWEISTRLPFRLPCCFELAPFASKGRDYYHGPAPAPPPALEIRNREDEHQGLSLF